MCTGKRMKLQRKAIHKSADEVAKALRCSRSTIFRYENGAIEKVPSSLIEKIATILETTPAYLMGWTDDPTDYDSLDDVWVPDEYKKKLGMGVKEYLAFKKAEDEDALKEQQVYTDDYTEHEKKVISAYRDHPDMQPAVDKILGIEPEPCKTLDLVYEEYELPNNIQKAAQTPVPYTKD